MHKAKAVVYQSVYVCTLRTTKLQSRRMSELELYVDSQVHEGLTGVLMHGENAIVALVEGAHAQVQAFISQAHPEPAWLIKSLMTQTASSARFYPGLALRLRHACAMPELMAFAADLRRSSKHDATWHADTQTLVQWLEPGVEQLAKGVVHAL
jgi:hypothetical protein